MDITFKEALYEDKDYRFHSCRIYVDREELEEFRIGTNGKGIQQNYALASAYGEFMERIQNNALFSLYDWVARPRFFKSFDGRFYDFEKYLRNKDLLLKYDIAPDESSDSGLYLKSKDFKTIETTEMDPLPYLPFYDVFKETVRYIPAGISYHCTSNGMCAGNTPKEAMIQGICEILERYAVRLIYANNLSLPSIPKKIFKGSLIYNHILELEKTHNWSIDIKDCSCNIGLPAIGILIINKSQVGYHFHIGADPSPITALERSITEIYQGRTEIPFNSVDIDYMIEVEVDSLKKEIESGRTYVDSTGQFPMSILSSIPSYEFSGFDENYGLSDDQDLQLLANLIKTLGFELFVRDVSYLGFPAYRIYIPGMSEIYRNFDNTHFPVNKFFLTAHNLMQANKKDVEELIQGVLSGRISIAFTSLNSCNDINKDYDLFVFFLYVKIEDYHKAHEYLVNYINKIPEDVATMYKCIRDVMFVRYIRKIEDERFLYKLYNKKVVKIIDRVLEQNRLLDLFNISSCFDCEKCRISSSCKLLSLLKISKLTEKEFEKQIPDQNEVGRYFKLNV